MVKCPECGLERKSIFKHIRTHGYGSKEEFLEKYPGTKLIDDSISKELSKLQKEINKDPEVLRHKSEASKRMWKDPEYREKSSKARVESARKQWLDRDSESVKNRIKHISEAQSNLWKDPKYRESQCQAFSDKWSDPEYRKEKLKTFTNARPYIREQDGKEIIARSTYEVTCTWYLDCLDLSYEYEKGPFEVYVPKEHRVAYYYPDFYIESKNLLIEVKSKFYYYKDKELNDLKFAEMKRQGFNHVLVMEEELKSIESFVTAINKELEKYGCADTLINLPQNGKS